MVSVPEETPVMVSAPEETPVMVSAPEERPETPLPSWGTFDYGGGLREVSIVKAIEEYYAYHHLRRPLDAFRRDVEKAGLKRAPSRASITLARDVEDVLADFDAGGRAEFTAAWERIMPSEFRAEREGRSLELRLQVHFATFRARKALARGEEPDQIEAQKDLEPFRVFLSARGVDEVCGDEGLMPLFALPFVQRPHQQPHVRDVFTASWLADLRRGVEAALRSQQPPVPLLYTLLEPPSSGSGLHGAWQAVWAELVRVADSSLDSAAMLAAGVPASAAGSSVELADGRRQLQVLCEQVPGGLELKLQSMNVVSPGGARSAGAASPSRCLRSRAATAPPVMPRDVDFGRLSRFICASPEERQHLAIQAGASKPPTLAAVLRALLQRLASAECPASQRRGFLVSVACFDALGVRASPQILPTLLRDPAVGELTLGILAVLACEAVGRSYIVANTACVEELIRQLEAQPLDSSPHIQALAALQRLSLRRATQDKMIELGLVEWVIRVLGWQGDAIQGMPAEFSLEFGSALLMNLALRTAGKQRCVELDTLTVALSLMEHWNHQIRTHINGTLYSLLSVPAFRERARRAGLEAVLRSIHAQAASLRDDISTKQVEYLLQQLNPVESQDSGDESGEEDEDDDENFLEEEELAGLLLGDRSGSAAEEALRHFTATPAVAEAQHREFRALLARLAAVPSAS